MRLSLTAPGTTYVWYFSVPHTFRSSSSTSTARSPRPSPSVALGYATSHQWTMRHRSSWAAAVDIGRRRLASGTWPSGPAHYCPNMSQPSSIVAYRHRARARATAQLTAPARSACVSIRSRSRSYHEARKGISWHGGRQLVSYLRPWESQAVSCGDEACSPWEVESGGGLRVHCAEPKVNIGRSNPPRPWKGVGIMPLALGCPPSGTAA